MSDEQVISDPSDLKKYRIELPNLADDSDLDVYEFRLLVHYKRVGECTEGLETTASKCGMSEGKASAARQSLADKGWIHLQRVEMDASRYRFIVRVADRWIENFARYSGLSEQEIAEQVKRASASPREGSPSRHEASASPREGKKEPIKNLRDDRFARIAQSLEGLTGSLKGTDADLIRTWTEKHVDEWIEKAIQMAKAKGARSANYVDTILIGWEANGYPKSRDEKVQGAKHANSNTGHSPRAGAKRSTPARTPAYTDADHAAADAINALP